MSTAVLEAEEKVVPVPLKVSKAEAQIKKFTEKLNANQPFGPWQALSFKGKGTPMKSIYNNVIIRKGVMNPREAAWLRYVQSKTSYGGYSWFVLGKDVVQTPIPGRNITILIPEKWYAGALQSGMWKFDALCGHTPEIHITNAFITRDAVACSIPDEKGKCVIYAHTGSNWAQRHTPLLYKEDDGINRAMLPNLEDWDQLAEYINKISSPDKRVICDIVKAISRNEAEAKLQAMIKESQG